MRTITEQAIIMLALQGERNEINRRAEYGQDTGGEQEFLNNVLNPTIRALTDRIIEQVSSNGNLT